MEPAQNILKKLEENRLQNAMLIRALRKYPDSEVVTYGDSIAVREPTMGMYFFALAKKGDFRHLLETAGSELSYTFLLTDEAYYEEVLEVLPTAAGVRYHQCVIETPQFMTEERPAPEGLELVKIDRSWMDFILQYYDSREFGNAEYVGRCLDENPAYGALLGGKKVGFHLSHLNGEMGPILVLPEARGMQLAKFMSHIITPEYLEGCGIGAAMVLPQNTNCLHHIRGTNLQIAPKQVVWVYTKDAEHYVLPYKIIHANKE